MKRWLSILTLLVMTISLLIMNATVVGAGVFSKTYTLDTDFNTGVMFNVNHDAPNNNQLQVNVVSTTYPVMWIANAGEDTVSKWNTNTNKELARYDTWFGNGTHGAWEGAAPSRTAVDADGNCYVANRQFDGSKPAVVFKILTNSFIDRNTNGVVDTCTDTNNNGKIDTAELASFQIVDTNANGRIDDAEIKDERVAWAVEVGPNGGLGRAVAIAPDGGIWIGLFNAQSYYKLSPINGSVLAGPIDVDVTPYGALVDKYNILWGLNYDYGLLKLNTVDNTFSIIPMTMGRCYSIALGYDAAGFTQVYMSSDTWSRSYIQYDTNPTSNPTNVLKSPASVWFNSLGIGTDTEGNIYVSNQSTGGGLAKFAPNGTLQWNVPTQQWSDSRAAVVDSDGNVWVVLLGASKLAKYNGSTGATMGLYETGYLPYTYSDATGISFMSSVQQGTWTVITNGSSINPGWTNISWNSSSPEGTSVTMRVRSSDDQNSWSGWEDVTNGGALTSTPNKQYLQVEALLKITEGNVSPILYDLTVNASNGIPPTPLPVEVGGDIYPVSRMALLTPLIVLGTILVAGAAILIWRRRTQS
jgi:hypothetical protein